MQKGSTRFALAVESLGPWPFLSYNSEYICRQVFAHIDARSTWRGGTRELALGWYDRGVSTGISTRNSLRATGRAPWEEEKR